VARVSKMLIQKCLFFIFAITKMFLEPCFESTTCFTNVLNITTGCSSGYNIYYMSCMLLTSESKTALNTLLLTVYLIVDLQDKKLQHAHLLALYLSITGWTPCLLLSWRIDSEVNLWMKFFKGESTIFGPL